MNVSRLLKISAAVTIAGGTSCLAQTAGSGGEAGAAPVVQVAEGESCDAFYDLSAANPSIQGLYFPTSASVPIAGADVQFASSNGTAQWSLTIGNFVGADGSVRQVGVLKGQLNVAQLPPQIGFDTRVVGLIVSAERAESILARWQSDPDAYINASIAVAREVGGPISADPIGDDEEEVGESPILGASCQCPPCPDLTQFKAAFVVLGVSFSPAGQICCGGACAIGCVMLAMGSPPAEAWIAGEGYWVTCMLGLSP